jgi:hypothetical protein
MWPNATSPASSRFPTPLSGSRVEVSDRLRVSYQAGDSSTSGSPTTVAEKQTFEALSGRIIRREERPACGLSEISHFLSLPQHASILLIIGAVLPFISFIFPASTLVFGIAAAWLGFVLFAGRIASVEQPSRVNRISENTQAR